MNVIVTNIQRSSFNDGPGLRTTVFFKGCSLHCPWCANPENINPQVEWYYDSSICLRSKNSCICNSNCPVLSHSKIDDFNCIVHAVNSFGRSYNENELYNAVISDKQFWTNGGGITFSGGEPFLQLYKVDTLLKILKSEDIHLAVETCLFVPFDNIKNIIQYIDLFYIDLKILDRKLCTDILGGDISLFYKNLKSICNLKKQIVYRIPLVPGYTATSENMQMISFILENFKPLKVEYFNIHNMGDRKYELLKRKPFKVSKTITDFSEINNMCKKFNIPYEYLKI